MPSDSTPDRRAIALAYLQVVLAGSLWGTSGPFSVALYRLGIPPTSVALLRPAAGLLFLALLVLWLRRRLPTVPRREVAVMLVLGGVIVGIFQLAYQMSTASVGVPATVALLYLAPGLVVGASAFLFREMITPLKALLVVVSIGGVWLTVLGARGVDVELSLHGVLWGCTCGASYASYTLFGKHFGRDYGALLPLFWSTVGGTVLLAVVWMMRGKPVVLPSSPVGWTVLLLFGLLTMALAALLLFNAMRTIEAGRASIGTTVEPLVAALLAMALLGQTLTLSGWIGLALLVTGVAGAYGLPEKRNRDARL